MRKFMYHEALYVFWSKLTNCANALLFFGLLFFLIMPFVGWGQNTNVFPPNGNVGIGTSSPTNKLEVLGDIYLDHNHHLKSNGILNLQADDDNSGDGVINFMAGPDTTLTLEDDGSVRLSDDANLYGLDILQGFNDLRFEPAPNSGVKMVITEPGRVGIGTTNPQQDFHVQGGDDIALFESSGDHAYLRLQTSEGSQNRVEFANRPGGKAAIWVGGSGDVVNVLRDGKVGIGIANPQNQLHVNGDIRVADDADLFGLDILQGHNDLRFEPTPNSGTDMVLTGEGKVGIGTVNPAARLHVSGSDNSTHGTDAAITISNTASGGGNWHLRAGATGSGTGDHRFSIGNDHHYILTMLGAPAEHKVGIGTTSPEAVLHVKGRTFGSGSLYTAMFENVNDQGGDGIAIKIHERNGQTGAGNHFVIFQKGDGTNVGRIQGYQYDGAKVAGMMRDLLYVMGIDTSAYPVFKDLINTKGSTSENRLKNLLLPNASAFQSPGLTSGQLPSSSGRSLPPIAGGFRVLTGMNPGSFPSFSPGSLDRNRVGDDFVKMLMPFHRYLEAASVLDVEEMKTRINSAGNSNVLQAFLGENPQAVGIANNTSPWDMARAAFATELLAWAKDDGVSYMAVGADYAEWLRKKDSTEQFVLGQIVGVKDGMISKETQDADQLMVISHNPIVLGNMIPANEEHLYEKVGFLGQVGVQVIGKVKAGDYIIASDLNNGFGIAIDPEEIRLEHFKRIVGRAWSENNNPLGIVNVAIGLKTNEWVSLFENQEQRMDRLEEELSAHQQDVGKHLEDLRAQLEAVKNQSEEPFESFTPQKGEE